MGEPRTGLESDRWDADKRLDVRFVFDWRDGGSAGVRVVQDLPAVEDGGLHPAWKVADEYMVQHPQVVPQEVDVALWCPSRTGTTL